MRPILGQSLRNKRFLENIAEPDTDSRSILLTGEDVIVDLMHDHSRMLYTVPVNNTSPVTMQNPIHKEERSLHNLTLDNMESGVVKTFTFGPDYIFLDGDLNTITVNIGQKRVFYGAIINGKLYLRRSVETIL